MGNLEEWLFVEMDYVSSLVGAAQGLKGSTLCLPVDCVAKVCLFYSKRIFSPKCYIKRM